MTIITNNYRDIPPRFGQALTIAVGHDRDRYAQFEYSYKQLYHVEKFFKINIGPKELKRGVPNSGASGIFSAGVVCIIRLLSTKWLCFETFLLLYAGREG